MGVRGAMRIGEAKKLCPGLIVVAGGSPTTWTTATASSTCSGTSAPWWNRCRSTRRSSTSAEPRTCRSARADRRVDSHQRSGRNGAARVGRRRPDQVPGQDRQPGRETGRLCDRGSRRRDRVPPPTRCRLPVGGRAGYARPPGRTRYLEGRGVGGGTRRACWPIVSVRTAHSTSMRSRGIVTRVAW